MIKENVWKTNASAIPVSLESPAKTATAPITAPKKESAFTENATAKKASLAKTARSEPAPLNALITENV